MRTSKLCMQLVHNFDFVGQVLFDNLFRFALSATNYESSSKYTHSAIATQIAILDYKNMINLKSFLYLLVIN